jgi:hypothetical protein
MTYEQSLHLIGDAWPTLSEETKLEVLQVIENHVALESGRINCPVSGEFLYTGRDGIALGAYDRETGTILINTSQLEPLSRYGQNAEMLITTCLHEGRHAYQNQVIQGIVNHDNPLDVQQWKHNLSEGNYIQFKENPRAYYNQPVELDARTFAENRYALLLKEKEQILCESKAPHESTLRAVFERQMEQKDQSVAVNKDLHELNNTCSQKMMHTDNDMDQHRAFG